MTQTRLYYPCEGLFIKADKAAGAYTFVHGVQSASDSVEIPTQDVNELGQITPYEIVEDTPNVTFDCERVIDGCCPIYLLATKGATSGSLTGRQDKRCVLAVAGYDSSSNYITGTPLRVCEFSGMQPTSVSYTFNVDGPFTESVSFVGDNRTWRAGGANLYGSIPSNPTANGTDEPCALTACSGGVQFKENLRFDGAYPTLLPTTIPGISASGTMPLQSNGCPTVPIQSISLSVDLNREVINQLGCKTAYARLVTFPVDVSCEIEVLSQSGDGVNISELGTLVGCEYTNAPESRIRVSTDCGLIIDLGDRNKLTGVSHTYGDSSGSNATFTLSFTGKSVMSVFHTVSDVSAITYSGFAI
jgi:hypothetical protein